MHAILLGTLLTVAPLAQDPDPAPQPGPTPEQVKAAVESLEQAFPAGETGERVRAIEGAAGVADGAVIALVAKGLSDPEGEVRLAALAALRFQKHPRALEELHAAHGKNRTLRENDKELAELLLAIGQHGSAKSVKLLADGPLDSVNQHSTRARILALGRTRSPEAVGELIALMNKAGKGSRGRANFRDDFRLALWALTGTDEGVGTEGWQRWWNDHKRDFTVPEQLAETPRELARRWQLTWQAPGDRGEKKARRKRDGGEEREESAPPR